jgi:Protein of unknown function (DUF3225)
MMHIDDPAILAELTEAFIRYETAFVANDIAALDAFFWHDARVTRYGVADLQHGIEAIRDFRASYPAVDLARELGDTRISTFGTDFGVASTLFFRGSAPGKAGRQMQSWVRMDGAWKIVAAHVSLIDDPR